MTQRVKTPDSYVLSRNRGCGDIVLYGGLFLVLFLIFGCPMIIARMAS